MDIAPHADGVPSNEPGGRDFFGADAFVDKSLERCHELAWLTIFCNARI